MRDEIEAIKSGRKELREFGLTIGAILVILGAVALWRGKAAFPYLFASGLILAALGIRAPAILRRAQKIWMILAVIIGFFMSRLILCVLFYGMITPMGIIARVLGRDLLDQRIDRSKPSYWIIRRGDKAKSSYENQY